MKRAYFVQGAATAALLLGASVALAQQDGQGDGATQEEMLEQEGGVPGGLMPGSTERIGAGTALNPSISVILDGVYKNTFSGEAREPAGFDSGHGHDHGHDHGHGLDDGFNLRETEFAFQASVDPYFDAFAMLVIEGTDSVDLEEAYFTTTSLPWGLQIKGGRFLSNIGYINSQHPHQWDFVDRPLVNEYLFGDHGLQETGVQLNWLLPTRTYAQVGIEALQGENEGVANYVGEDDHLIGLEDAKGPRLVTTFAKVAPDLGFDHALQFGISGGYGRTWQAGEEHSSGRTEVWDGDAWFAGADLVYKYDAGRQYGHGDWTLQAEYFYRVIDVDFTERDDDELVTATFSDESKQDGIYLQTVYGFAPRWRAGLRGEALGLTNRSLEPHDDHFEEFDTSYRYSANVTFFPSHFSYIRGQVNYADFAGDDHGHGHGHGDDEWTFMLQYNLSLGAHGAHPF